MKVIHQDLFNVTEGIIAHSVNCQGIMGAGVARLVRQNFPNAYEHYIEVCDKERYSTSQLLGLAQVVPVSFSPDLYVANMFCQDDINRGGPRGRYTNYGAVATAFQSLNFDFNGYPIYIPYRMCCDLGGASWDIFEEIVDAICPGVIACSLNPV